MNGRIVKTWRGGRHVFSLAALGSIFDLQDECRAGLGLIAQRLENGIWYLQDVREPIRIGLIGGGMDPVRAQDIVDRHVVPPLNECVPLAYEIVTAAIVNPEGEPQPGKATADRDQLTSPSIERTGDSPGSPSTTQPESLAGTPAT